MPITSRPTHRTLLVHKHSGTLLACSLLGWALAACSADSAPAVNRAPAATGSAMFDNTAAGAAPASGDPAAPGSEAFGNGAGAARGAAGTGALVPATGAPADNTCAEGMARATPVTPTVWLVVDGSSSMNSNFGAGATRWETLRATLMDAGAIVDSLQSVVRFGMVIYSGGGGGGGGLFGQGTAAECVQLVTVEPALDNHATLAGQYPTAPIGTGTPTDKAVAHVVDNLPVLNEQMLDVDGDPIYVVLATDGGPNDTCGGGGFGAGAEQQVIDVVSRGTAGGMNMFVISLAGDDAQLQAHLDQVAQITQTATPPFVPATRDELVQTFQDIVGGATCRVALDGMVTEGRECAGSVTLNGGELACNTPDGWQLDGPRTVQLTGAACERFLGNESMLLASFPCDVFAPD